MDTIPHIDVASLVASNWDQKLKFASSCPQDQTPAVEMPPTLMASQVQAKYGLQHWTGHNY